MYRVEMRGLHLGQKEIEDSHSIFVKEIQGVLRFAANEGQ
jgi:hypothetical protein